MPLVSVVFTAEAFGQSLHAFLGPRKLVIVEVGGCESDPEVGTVGVVPAGREGLVALVF
jgi:hypothetical protein